MCADTGDFTGRSPKDKFTVRDATTDKNMWWAGNQSITSEQFEALYTDFLKHAEGMTLFAQDLYGGADPSFQIKTRVFTELAWHSLFIRTLLIRPELSALADFVPELTIIDMPSFRADPKRHGVRSENVVAIDFARKIVLIGGSYYAGEMKKSVFTTLNYYLPAKGVMPMHCSANVGPKGDAAIFFGLSGTGKTTLSADPKRTLIGDDEHGWGRDGIFNFEGGCYAKCIKLSKEAEPEIYAASKQFGAVLENVVLDENTRAPDFDNGSKTENTRSAYPLDFIPNASRSGRAGHPKNVVMLAADAFGVLPPIAKLSPAQAMYHFLSGYTAKVAGTERGLGSEPQPEFSTCFASPFLPLDPSVYGNMLRELIAKHNVDCWLVNTGWTGGKFGTGSRMPIKVTRALLSAALDGSLRTWNSAPTSISVLRSRPRCPAYPAKSSIPSTPGKTRPSSTRPRGRWSACSRRTLPSSKPRSMPMYAPRRRKPNSRPSEAQAVKRSGQRGGRETALFTRLHWTEIGQPTIAALPPGGTGRLPNGGSIPPIGWHSRWRPRLQKCRVRRSRCRRRRDGCSR